MSGETIVVKGTPKILEANGAAITNGSVVQADDANYDVVADGVNFPDAKFVASFTFSTAPTEGTMLALYARPLDIDGTNDAEIPESTRPTVYIGPFVVNNVTTTQYAELMAQDAPWIAAYYLHNNSTGQTVSSGWTLTVTPYSLKTAA